MYLLEPVLRTIQVRIWSLLTFEQRVVIGFIAHKVILRGI